MARLPALLLLFGTLACSASERAFQTCTVVAVYDGDTLTALCAGNERRIRLSSVDAPEAAQSYGAEAQRFTASRTLNREVEVEVHDYDKYGRVVARLILPDGNDLARELVRAGFAWHYVKYSRDPELGMMERLRVVLVRAYGARQCPNPRQRGLRRSRKKIPKNRVC